MTIQTPLSLHDQVMTSGRVFSNITSIEGSVGVDGIVKHLVYCTDKVSRYRLVDFIRPSNIEEKDYKTISLTPPYNLNDEVLYLNSSYSNIGILTKGKISRIDFNVSFRNKLYWYSVNKNNLDKYEIYRDIDDFIYRTKPKRELKDGEKYIFTDYCLQQNTIVPVKVEKVSETHFKIVDGYNRGETIRGSKLYNSHQSFINNMTAQIK